MLKENELKILKTIATRKVYEDKFFKEISGVKWFFPLKEKGYFEATRSPGPQEAKEEGYFVIPHWNVLNYLEKISAQVDIDDYETYALEIMDIINNVTKYHTDHTRQKDNYRTWWYFVKILINIPNDKIVKYLKKNSIQIGKDWIREWIASKLDNMLPASDIATKLLPKFLTQNQQDIEVAEQIIGVITDIKEDYFKEEAAQKIGLFEMKKEPETKVDSHWLRESFKKNADKIGKLCSDTLIFDLANKLKKILDREHNTHQVLIELNNNTYRITASRIEGFRFEFSIEQLDKEEIAALKPEDRVWGVLKVGGETLYSFSKNNVREREAFVRTIKQEIEGNPSISVLKSCAELDKELNNLYRGFYSDYSSIWYKSLSKSPDVGIHDAKELLVFILRDILLSKCATDSSAGKAILENFLNDEYQYPLFRRFVLLVINNLWVKYKDLFWKFLEVIPEPFDESAYEVELYKLLQQHVLQFTSDEKKKVEALINKGPRWRPDEKQDYHIAYWKQKRYSAMMADEHFLKLYEEQKKITGVQEIEPPAEEAFVTRWGEGPAPLTKEDIIEMNNADLVKYLNEFKTKDRWKGPTEGGLAEVLKAAVKENPDKFVNDLHMFLDVKYKYLYKILDGLEDAWKEKKSFNWDKLFTFAKGYIERTDFFEKAKEDQDEDWLVRHVWIINVMADLIHEGAKDDSWAFPEDYFAQAEEILDISITKLPVEYNEEESTRDAVTYALNTSYGRVIEALISLALRKARVEDKKKIKKELRWDPARYESLFKKGVIEAFTFLGWYMPNFAYLNKQWVERKIKEFEDLKTEDIKWQSFMEGYLSGHRVYDNFYGLMRTHYIRGIEKDVGKGRTKNRVVQHITIGYLRGNESLEGKDSLFKKIIDKWNYFQIKEIVDFFWSQARYLENAAKQVSEEERIRDRIIEFWRWTYKNREMIENKLKDDYRKLLSDLSHLTVLLEKIDPETSEWLLLSAPLVGEEFNSSFFVEYLDKFNDQESIKHVSKIFIKMLSTTLPSSHKEENIKSIVEKIYKSGNKADGVKICKIFGSQGYEYEFLRPIYETYNK